MPTCGICRVFVVVVSSLQCRRCGLGRVVATWKSYHPSVVVVVVVVDCDCDVFASTQLNALNSDDSLSSNLYSSALQLQASRNIPGHIENSI